MKKLFWGVGVFVLLLACSSYTWSFPNKIHGFRLVKLIKGKEALQEINKLHGRKIQAVKGAIAVYIKEGRRAVVWVSQAPSDKVAFRQVEVMMEKMKKASPFYEFTMDRIGCLLVYSFLGLGQEHYLFSQDDAVYWISAPRGEGRAFLRVFARKGCPLSP